MDVFSNLLRALMWFVLAGIILTLIIRSAATQNKGKAADDEGVYVLYYPSFLKWIALILLCIIGVLLAAVILDSFEKSWTIGYTVSLAIICLFIGLGIFLFLVAQWNYVRVSVDTLTRHLAFTEDYTLRFDDVDTVKEEINSSGARRLLFFMKAGEKNKPAMKIDSNLIGYTLLEQDTCDRGLLIEPE